MGGADRQRLLEPKWMELQKLYHLPTNPAQPITRQEESSY